MRCDLTYLCQATQLSLERVLISSAGACTSTYGFFSTSAKLKMLMRLETPAVAKNSESRSNSMLERMADDWRALAGGSCANTFAAGAQTQGFVSSPLRV